MSRDSTTVASSGEGGRRRRSVRVVRRHVYRWMSDGADLGGSDALLQAPFFRERRLIAHREASAKQPRTLGSSRRETVDVVDEEQDVAASSRKCSAM